MSLTYRSLTNVLDADVGSVSVPKPSGTIEGDLLLCVAAVGNPNAEWATPSGFTTLLQATGGAQPRISVFYRIAGPSEPSSYTVSVTSGLFDLMVVMLRYNGHAWGSPLEASGSDNGNASSSDPASSPSVTTSLPDSTLLLAACEENRNALPTPSSDVYPNNTNGRVAMEFVDVGTDGTMAVAEAAYGGPGSTPSYDWTFDPNSDGSWRAVTVALRGLTRPGVRAMIIG